MEGRTDALDGFSPNFAEQLIAAWNRGPCVFRNALSSPLFTEQEFMTAFVGAAADYVADPNAKVPPGRLYVNGELATADRVAPLLPKGAAETYDHYASRIRQAHPQDGIGIVLDNCEKYVPATRERLVRTLHRLFAHAGYPARRNHLCIYAGTYRSTPFGIHRDDCHVVMFCGIGTKRMAFWPRPYFDQRKELFVGGKLRARLSDHIADATVLEIGPRDVLYWSADDWHVAVSDTDDFQAALSVGIYHQGSSAEVMASLDFLAGATRIEGLDIDSLPGAPAGRLSGDALRASHLSAFFERWQLLQDMVSRSGEADYRALSLALRLISSAGYGKLRTPRPELPAQLAGSVVACGVPESLIVGRARGGLLVGANGTAFFYEHSMEAIEDMVLGLRDGQSRRYDDLTDSVAAGSGEAIGSAIRDLINAGALSLQPAGALSGGGEVAATA